MQLKHYADVKGFSKNSERVGEYQNVGTYTARR